MRVMFYKFYFKVQKTLLLLQGLLLFLKIIIKIRSI